VEALLTGGIPYLQLDLLAAQLDCFDFEIDSCKKGVFKYNDLFLVRKNKHKSSPMTSRRCYRLRLWNGT